MSTARLKRRMEWWSQRQEQKQQECNESQESRKIVFSDDEGTAREENNGDSTTVSDRNDRNKVIPLENIRFTNVEKGFKSSYIVTTAKRKSSSNIENSSEPPVKSTKLTDEVNTNTNLDPSVDKTSKKKGKKNKMQTGKDISNNNDTNKDKKVSECEENSSLKESNENNASKKKSKKKNKKIDSETEEKSLLKEKQTSKPGAEVSNKESLPPKKNRKRKLVNKKNAEPNEDNDNLVKAEIPAGVATPKTDAGTSKTDASTPSEKMAKKEKVDGKKYVLFVGNLHYRAKKSHVEKHFSKCGLKAVRFLTEKITGRARGFAYIELNDGKGFKQALLLHKSSIMDREINVEFTSIGSGKSVQRRANLKAKNERCGRFKVLRPEADRYPSKGRQDDDKGEL